MSVNYRVKGLDKFIRNVEHKSDETQKKVDRELNLSSLRVERRAKVNAPWDTGWMANNIYSTKEGELSYVVVSPVGYSVFIELGTRFMIAQPFLYPALQKENQILLKRLSKIVKG